jgi:hypothetical protein
MLMALLEHKKTSVRNRGFGPSQPKPYSFLGSEEYKNSSFLELLGIFL